MGRDDHEEPLRANGLSSRGELRTPTDHRIGAIVRDVAVPEGLKSRVLAAVSARDAERSKTRGWRSWAWRSAAASVLIVVGLTTASLTRRPATIDAVHAEALNVYAQLVSVPLDANDWQETDWPVGFVGASFQGGGWVTFLGATCRTYSFRDGFRQAVAIMVPRRKFPSTELPLILPKSVQGVSIVCFASGDYVCVAVVEGEVEDLGAFRATKSIT